MLDSHWHTYSMLYIYLFELFFTNQMQGSKQTGLSEHLQICAHPVWFPQQLSSTRCRLLAGSQGIPGKQWNCRRRRNTSGWFNMWLSWLVNIAPINTHLEKTESIRGFLMILHFTTARKIVLFVWPLLYLKLCIWAQCHFYYVWVSPTPFVSVEVILQCWIDGEDRRMSQRAVGEIQTPADSSIHFSWAQRL